MTKKQYVAGAIFDSAGQRLILIKKLRPNWQSGLYNFPGGKLEIGETLNECMSRETKEEIGLEIKPNQFKHYVTLEGNDWAVHFFKCKTPSFHKFKQMEDEIPEIFNASNLPKNTISNIPWLVEMARCTEYDNWVNPLIVIYPAEYQQ